MVTTNMPGAPWRRPVTAPSSRNTCPPLIDGPDFHNLRSRDGGFEQRRGGVEGGQAGNAALHRRAPDLEAVLEHRPAPLARLGVDVRHRVDDEVDLTLRDDVEHGRSFLADLRHHPRREAGPPKRLPPAPR